MTAAGDVTATTEDAFLGGALRIRQPAAGYRAGLDAVLLAAAAPLDRGGAGQVLDVGAGAGVVGLSAARRMADARVTLVEREAELAGLARANAALNGLEDRVRVIEGDVGKPIGAQAELAALVESFDHALANPPYHAEGSGTASATRLKALAHAMPRDGLEDWLRFMAAMVRPGGSATMIHRADRLGEILAAFSRRFGRLIVFPIFPRPAMPAHRVLVQGIKGSAAPLEIRAGLVLHRDGHGFRPEAEAILRGGAALDLAG